MTDFFLRQLEVELVDIIERHLVPVSSENHKLLSNHH